MAKDESTEYRGHPISAFARQIEADLQDLVQTQAWSMDDTDLTDTTLRVVQLEAQVAELNRRLLAEAHRRDVAAQTGGTSTANWLAHNTKLTRPEARKRVRQAKALDAHESTRTALATGGLHVEQADVITRAVDALPTEKCPPEIITKVEETLIENASLFDADALKILGWRVWEILDPEGAQAYEAEQLAKEEDSARNQTKLTMHDDGTGAVRGRFVIPSAQGAMFRKLLLAFAAPKHQAATADRQDEAKADELEQKRAATPKRMGEAFCELIESFRTDDHPDPVVSPRPQ